MHATRPSREVPAAARSPAPGQAPAPAPRLPARAPLLAGPALAALLCAAAVPAPSAAPPPAPAPQDEAPAPDERDLVEAFERAFKANEPASRAAAVLELSEASRELPDGGTSRRIARVLAKALAEDEDLEVKAAGVRALAWGRDVDVVLEAWKELLFDLATHIGARITRPDEESRAFVRDATRLFRDACQAIARYRDDRTVELLSERLRVLDRNTASDNTSTLLVRPLAEALLALGTREAVELVVEQTQVYVGGIGYQRVPSRMLHEALAAFADAAGRAPPPFGEQVDVAWGDWFRAHEELFAERLGKLQEPPGEPPYEAPVMRMRRERESAGGPERP